MCPDVRLSISQEKKDLVSKEKFLRRQVIRDSRTVMANCGCA